MIELKITMLNSVTGGAYINKQKINNASFNGTRFNASLNNLNMGDHDTLTIGGSASVAVGNLVGGDMKIS